MGSLLVAKFHQAAMSRANLPENERRNFWCYIDEFHNFITPSMAEILSGARKYRIGLILAHQELRQLQRDSDVASAVLSQPYTRVCFRVGDDDARKLDDGFSFFEAKDLQSLPNFEAICRVERADFDFNIAIPFPKEANEAEAAKVRKQVITSSRKKYAVPRKDIEAELWKRSAIQEADTAKPKISKTEKAPESPKETKPIEIVTEVSKPISAPIVSATPAMEAPAQVIPERRIPSSTPNDMGRGGNQHKAIQQRIKGVGESLGFGVTIEKGILEGQGSVDVLLEKGERIIACEISFTTTIDHEVGNVIKCLKGGFPHVAVICLETERLNKIARGVSGCLSAGEAACVGYYVPDQFVLHLQELALQDTPLPNPGEMRLGKYKVKRQVSKLTPDETKAQENAVFKMLADSIFKNRKK